MNNKETVPVMNYLMTSDKQQKEVSDFFHDFTCISKLSHKKGDFLVGKDRGNYTVFSAPGIHIWDGKIEITSTHKLLLKTIKPAFQLIFCVEGAVEYHSGNETNSLKISNHNLLF